MSRVERWDDTTDGPISEAAMTRKLAQRGCTVHRYIYPPGTSFPDHAHGVDKIDGVLAGRFRMTMTGQEVILAAGDCLVVPRGAIHRAEVVVDEPVISLDAVRG